MLKARLIEVTFLEKKEDKEPKMITIFTKRARGTMANWVVKNRVAHAEDLKRFNVNGYEFDEDLSEGDRLVFVRSI